MTAEHVQMYAKAYRLYFLDRYDFPKYHGHISTPPLIKQRDRQFYHRLSKKLNDEQVHATLLLTHFFTPSAFIADACTPEAMSAGIQFASRAENGLELLKHDLYTLRKQVPAAALDDWLYGEALPGGHRSQMPLCLGDVLRKSLPLDLACLLLLIPRPELDYDWTGYWSSSTLTGTFGVGPWISRLRKVDQLLLLYRPQWRHHGHLLSKGFWSSYRRPLTPPDPPDTQNLFDNT